jgi:hypothetical protein
MRILLLSLLAPLVGCTPLVNTCKSEEGCPEAFRCQAGACLPSVPLQIQLVGNGAGTLRAEPEGLTCSTTACSGEFVEGSPVVLTGLAMPGSRFAGWSEPSCPEVTPCTVTPIGPTQLTASFAPSYSVAVTLTGSGSGRVTSTPAGMDCPSTCTLEAERGPVRLTATPASGSRFVRWSDARCPGTASCELNQPGVTSLSAEFVRTHRLTVDLAGDATGTVSASPLPLTCSANLCTALFDEGAAVLLNAQAAGSGARFAGWSGDCTGTDPCTLQMTAARRVTATFTRL